MEGEGAPCNRIAGDVVRISSGSYDNGFLARLISLNDADLKEKDINGIKFLCRDFIPGSRLEKCNEGIEIFKYLIEIKLITEKNIDILLECLCRINRLDWIEKLHFKPYDVKQKVNKETKLKPFRVMLFNIAEEISVEEVSKIRYYLQNIIPGHQNRNISSCTTMVEAFTLCEKMGLLDETKIKIIYEMLELLKRDDLLDEVNEYAENAGLIQYLDPLPGSHVHHQVNHGPSPSGNAGSCFGGQVHTRHSELRGQDSEYDNMPSIVAASTMHHAQTPNPPHNESVSSLQDRRMITSESSPAHVAVKPYLHGNYTVFPHAERTQPSCISNAGLSVAPLTYDIISESNFIPAVSYEFYAPRAKSSSVTSEKPQWQFMNEVVSTSGSELVGRTAITEAEFATGFPDTMPHHTSQVVPSGTAIGQSHEHPESLQFIKCYKMDAKPRGICLIINNEKFYKEENDEDSEKLKDREGTDVDCKKLQNLFNKLHFTVEIRNDQTDLQIYQLMSQMSKKVDHSDYDCFVCCVLSHGTEGNIFGSNGKEVPIINLTSFFVSDRCPSLAGKPKVFFFQACQGSEKQSGYEMEQDAPDIVKDTPNKRVIPREADFLLGFATVAGYTAFRSTSEGSLYINKLVQMLERYHEREDVLSILVRVNGEVCNEDANCDSGVYKQTPAPMFTLTKQLYF